MADQSNKPPCIYCGGAVHRVRKGEHIIPEAIGGTRTIKQVCRTCNNEVLADLDRELCSRSPLSVVAAQELDAHVWQTWDVDHHDGNLLLEGKPEFTRKSMTQFPQLVFESAGPQIRGDYEEMRRFGWDDFQKVFVKFMMGAFRAYKGGHKRRLIFHQVALSPDFLERYRYPPRVFARRPIERFRKGMAFELRYQSDAHKQSALHQLENWNPDTKWSKLQVGLGSELPALRCFYDPNKVLRALAKMGINLLAAYCPNTPIDREHFRDVIGAVIGEAELNPSLLRRNGFVWPRDLESIRFKDGHSFRLLYDQGQWHIYSSFFNGGVCSVVSFRGPNCEEWCCADISAPIRSCNWEAVTSKILLPLRTHVEWQDMARVIPSVELLNVQSEMVVEQL